jgi:hypothetical protein
MYLSIRTKGSQKLHKVISLTAIPNWSGQGGSASLVFETDDTRYISIVPETLEDVKSLMSLSLIISHNFGRK